MLRHKTVEVVARVPVESWSEFVAFGFRLVHPNDMAENRKLKVKPTPHRTNHHLIFLRTYEAIKTALLFYSL